MKRIDGLDICINWVILPLTIIATLMMIISFIGLHYQNDCFIEQNEYCVVLDKDSRLIPQVIGKYVSTRRLNQIDAVGLTTQDTVTIDVDRYIFGNVEIGDTVKTANLR